MNKVEIEAQVRQFLIDECGAPEALGTEEPLFSSRTLDSVDVVALISFIEQRFGIRVPPLEVNLDKLDSVGLIVDMVVQHRTT